MNLTKCNGQVYGLWLPNKCHRFKWEDLEKYFTAPKIISPFYGDNIKIPRKLKKKVKCFCGVHWEGLTNGQRLWYYMEKSNNDYKRFLLKQVCRANGC